MFRMFFLGSPAKSYPMERAKGATDSRHQSATPKSISRPPAQKPRKAQGELAKGLM